MTATLAPPLLPPDYKPFSGVKTAPPPPRLIPDLNHSITNALTMLQGDETVAAIAVGTKKGDEISYNLVVVGKLPNKKWDLSGALWIGSKWGESVEAGAMLKWAF